MTDISYLIGDATEPIGDGKKIIAHICNDIGKWGKGFVVPLGKKYPKAKECYLKSFSLFGGKLKLGDCEFIYNDDIIIANMIAQHGIYNKNNTTPIRYGSLFESLKKVAQCAKNTSSSIHMPRIGCGLANGSWNIIEGLIKETLCENNLLVYVYDLK